MAPAATGPDRDPAETIRARAAQWSVAERALDADRAARLAAEPETRSLRAFDGAERLASPPRANAAPTRPAALWSGMRP